MGHLARVRGAHEPSRREVALSLVRGAWGQSEARSCHGVSEAACPGVEVGGGACSVAARGVGTRRRPDYLGHKHPLAASRCGNMG